MKFIKLLKNKNLKKLFCASANSDEAEIWLQLAELGRKGAFTTNKTFEELVRLMVQIKKLETAGKRKTGIWYSEHLHQFFSLIFENSRTYEIFKNAFAGMSLSSIRQVHFHSKDQDILTSPEISLENIACFAKIANELHWKGPVVLITDCMKL
ncbi:hypothetical protein RirG_098160 [Rhizophagus irregularis DAOM 197198w]|uniref:Uncharacterized protein n=1 Tax=Rhizophagus irregularis (strain DAOM 197198w) TaxID=1432141 RepID=A0A015JPP9_RHIIW|nr:hypothetical protein RirG_098160 [Rhizophagus irregularis DAOM 197198w]